jgi:hypothetical protein
MINRKKLAKEWLYLISSLAVGFLILPLVISLLYCKHLQSATDSWLDFYDALLGIGGYGRVELIPWFIGMCPYILCQTIRATIWSIKMLKQSNK